MAADLVGERVSDVYNGRLRRSTAWAATAAAFGVRLCVAANRRPSRLRVCGSRGLGSQAAAMTPRTNS